MYIKVTCFYPQTKKMQYKYKVGSELFSVYTDDDLFIL